MSLDRGRFITIEGGEGVGKSSFQAHLTKTLSNRGIKVVETREPGGTPAADKMREIFNHPPENDPLTIEAEAFLVSAARAQHCGRVVGPALVQGQWVVSDRFADSTRVYQGILGGLDKELLETLIRSSTANLQPDVTFLLDCPVAISLKRLGQRADLKTRYDQASAPVHERLRQAFLSVAKDHKDRFIVLDASQSQQEVAEAAIREMDQRFGH